MKISTKLSALALLAGAMMSFTAQAETQENLYDFANNNLNLEVATPADWEDATKGVISGQEIRQGDVVLTAIDGAKVNRMWRTNGGVQYLQVGGKITLKADEGRAIKSVNFGVQNYKFYLEAQAGNGSLDADNYVWTGNATAITFDNENAANEYNTQSLLLTMTVTTDDADANTYTPSETTYAECANIAEFLALEVGTPARLTLTDAQVNGAYWGGIFVEVLKDVSSGLAPLSYEEAYSMIHSLRGYKIIKGTRGQAGVNEKKYAEIIVRLSTLLRFATEIKEMDINPLLADENDVIAVDARILVEK